MFTQPAPAPPTLATTTSPASPTSPTRTGRLRGLSYLRSYTHTHLLSRDSSGNSSTRPISWVRTNSLPSPSSPHAASPSADDRNPASQFIAEARRSNTDSVVRDAAGLTSGWLPTGPRQSGTTRVPAEPQSVITSASASGITSGSGTGVDDGSEVTAMARTRSAAVHSATTSSGADIGSAVGTTAVVGDTATSGRQGTENLPSIRFTAHQDLRSTDRGPPRPSLVFSPMSRTLPTGTEVIRVGRYSERDNVPQKSPHVPSAAPVGFKSKVVSRRHCEFWCQSGRWFIKDVKSSSGTFLNHVRLSAPGVESKPFPINDGDIVQLGIDFKGGEEMIFRCVKIRIELNRGWQNSLNTFNLQSHKRLRDLRQQGQSTSTSSSQDCSICLGPVAPCQSLFVAPCSHTWHYKCVRVIINGPTWPQFVCPNCRAVADLEAEVDDPYADGEWEDIGAVEAEPSRANPSQIGTSSAPVSVEPPQLPPVAIYHASSQAENNSETPMTVQEAFISDPAALQTTSAMDIDEPVEARPVPTARSELQPSPNITSNAVASPIPIPQSTATAAQRFRSSNESDGERELASSASSHSNQRSEGNRTPSPASRLAAIAREAPTDGPMTPRNDAGPFVFDGSAGRAAGANMAALINATSTSSEEQDQRNLSPTPESSSS